MEYVVKYSVFHLRERQASFFKPLVEMQLCSEVHGRAWIRAVRIRTKILLSLSLDIVTVERTFTGPTVRADCRGLAAGSARRTDGKTENRSMSSGQLRCVLVGSKSLLHM